MKDITLGYAFCGSFCTMEKSVEILEELAKEVNITPIILEEFSLLRLSMMGVVISI